MTSWLSCGEYIRFCRCSKYGGYPAPAGTALSSAGEPGDQSGLRSAEDCCVVEYIGWSEKNVTDVDLNRDKR
jgi:hypothetical protein